MINVDLMNNCNYASLIRLTQFNGKHYIKSTQFNGIIQLQILKNI